MPVSAGQVVRMDLVADFNSTEDIINVFQFRKEGGTSLTDQEVLDDLMEIAIAIVNIINNFITAVTVWRRIRAQNMSTGLLIGEQDFSPTISGGLTGSSNAVGVAGLVSFGSNVPRVTLRKYFGPVGEDALGGNGIISATPGVNDLVAVGALLTADMTQTNGVWRYGYLSPKTAGFVVPNSAIISNVPGYQRRRRQGVGS